MPGAASAGTADLRTSASSTRPARAGRTARLAGVTVQPGGAGRGERARSPASAPWLVTFTRDRRGLARRGRRPAPTAVRSGDVSGTWRSSSSTSPSVGAAARERDPVVRVAARAGVSLNGRVCERQRNASPLRSSSTFQLVPSLEPFDDPAARVAAGLGARGERVEAHTCSRRRRRRTAPHGAPAAPSVLESSSNSAAGAASRRRAVALAGRGRAAGAATVAPVVIDGGAASPPVAPRRRARAHGRSRASPPRAMSECGRYAWSIRLPVDLQRPARRRCRRCCRGALTTSFLPVLEVHRRLA